MSNYDMVEKEDLNLMPCGLDHFYKQLKEAIHRVAFFGDGGEKVQLEGGGEATMTLDMALKPFLVLGSPGIGKTVGVVSAVKEINAELKAKGMADRRFMLVKIMLGQTIVGELSGMPVVIRDKDGKERLQRIQLEDLPKAEDSEYGILFLDEITTADKAQILPALGFADDSRSISGGYKLPDHWIVVCAGNGPNSRNFNYLPSVLLDRCRKFNIEYDYARDFRNYVFGLDEDGKPSPFLQPFHPYVRGFLEFKPEYVLKEMGSIEHKADSASPCPRQWKGLSDMLIVKNAYRQPGEVIDYVEVANEFVGKEAAAKFGAFVEYAPDDINGVVDSIINGKEVDMQYENTEQFMLVTQGVVSKLTTILNQQMEKDANGEPVLDAQGYANFPKSSYEVCVNIFKYYLSNPANSLDAVCSAIYNVAHKVPYADNIFSSDDFSAMCPEFDTFLAENEDILASPMITFEI